MARDVLIMADLRGSDLRNVTLEALGAATRIASGGKVSALVVGSGAAQAASALFDHGADDVLLVQGDQYANYTPDAYAGAVLAALEETQASVLLLAHSAVGRDIAPIVAACKEAGQVSDAIAIDVDGGDIVCTRPIYAGKAFTKVTVDGPLAIITVRPNNLPAPEPLHKVGEARELSVPTVNARTQVREVVRKVADYGIVGDLFDVVPALTAEVKRAIIGS
ncbi:MAG: hypothetical protein OWT27_00755 [Firmicutes bacterium]|nr:hypothetical protein [Bacillota bacterium]